MRRNLLIFTIILTLLAINLNVYDVEENKKDKILEEAQDYYIKEYQQEIEETNKKIDEYINENYTSEKIHDIVPYSGGTKNLNVPLYQ